MSQSNSAPIPFPAEKAYALLHTHAVNGYLPGDCHCETCDLIVTDLCDVLGITAATHTDPATGIWSPAAALRDEAAKRGWR